MTRGQRVFTYIAATFGVVGLGCAALAAGVFIVGGVATVSVSERSEGLDFSLPIPMALVHVAVAATDVFLVDEIIDEIEMETGGRFSEWAPVAMEIVDALDEVPNGTTFVAVDDGAQRVRVTKTGGKLRVEVESPDLTLKVAVPTRSVQRVVALLVH